MFAEIRQPDLAEGPTECEDEEVAEVAEVADPATGVGSTDFYFF